MFETFEEIVRNCPIGSHYFINTQIKIKPPYSSGEIYTYKYDTGDAHTVDSYIFYNNMWYPAYRDGKTNNFIMITGD